jgi:hypothetical protein
MDVEGDKNGETLVEEEAEDGRYEGWGGRGRKRHERD